MFCVHWQVGYDNLALIGSVAFRHDYEEEPSSVMGGGRSWGLLLQRVHLETSYLNGQFVLDSSSGDL